MALISLHLNLDQYLFLTVAKVVVFIKYMEPVILILLAKVMCPLIQGLAASLEKSAVRDGVTVHPLMCRRMGTCTSE